MTKLSNYQCSAAMARRETFSNRTGSLTGSWSTNPETGYMPDEWVERFRADRAAHNGVLYIVRSYDTPIAWAAASVDDVLLTVPNVGYSATTSQHQGLCLSYWRTPWTDLVLIGMRTGRRISNAMKLGL